MVTKLGYKNNHLLTTEKDIALNNDNYRWLGGYSSGRLARLQVIQRNKSTVGIKFAK